LPRRIVPVPCCRKAKTIIKDAAARRWYVAEDNKSVELAGIVESALHEFSEAMRHREQLSIRIGRRTTQIIRFGMFGLSVLGLIMFYLLHILTTDFARITSNMEIMSGRMTTLNDNFARVSISIDDLQRTLTRKLADLPVDKVANNLLAASQSINRLAGSPELQQSLVSLNEATGSINRILKSPDTRKALASLHTTLDALESLSRALERHVEPMSSDMHAALVETRNTLAQAHDTLASAQQLVGDEKLLYSINAALAEITGAAREMRNLTELLERQPQSILRGKDTAEER
jgi:paraquat-inducible protein B